MNPMFILCLVVVLFVGYYMVVELPNSPYPDLIPAAWVFYFLISGAVLVPSYLAG